MAMPWRRKATSLPPPASVELADPKRAELIAEVGRSGTAIFGGILTEEYRSDLSGLGKYTIYDRMTSDAQISAVLSVIELPIRAADWSVQVAEDADAREQEIAEFVADNLWGMSQPWDEVIRQALYCVRWGVMLLEKVYRVEDGRLVWDRFAPRLPRTIWRWIPNPDGSLAEVEQNVYGDLAFTGRIPASKLLRFTFRQEGSNFEGRSLLRDVYKHWWHKDTLYKLSAIAMERTGVGVPIATVPAGASPTDVAKLREIVKSFRANEEAGIVLPDGFKFDISQARGSYGFMPLIDHHNREIAKAALAPFLNLGDSTGSWALSRSQTDLFLTSLDGLTEMIRAELQRGAVAELVRLNFGADAPVPELRYMLQKSDPSALATTLAALVSGKLLTPDDRIEAVLRESLDLPPKSEDTPRVAPDSDEQESEPSAQATERIRGRIGFIALAEWVHDPSAGGGLRREPNERESAYRFAEIQDEWDAYERVLRASITREAERYIAMFLRRFRSELAAGSATPWDITLPQTLETALSEAMQRVGDEAMEWARSHVAEVAKLPSAEVPARHAALLKATFKKASARFTANMREEMTRKIAHDPEWAGEMIAGMVGESTVNRVVSEARANVAAVLETHVAAVAQVTIGESIRAGFDAVMRHPSVTAIERSELLDSNTCPNCAAVDGKVFTRDEWFSASPPRWCAGGSRCRGVGIPILADESPQPETTAVSLLPSMETTRMHEGTGS